MTLFGLQLNLPHSKVSYNSPAPSTLAYVPVRSIARVLGFSPRLLAERRAQLLAYGLSPGTPVRVVQHSPVTIIEVDQIELALERDMADLIFIEAL